MPWRKSCVWVLNNLTHTIQGGKIGSGNKAVPWRPRAFTAHAAIDLSISLSSVTSLSSSCMEQGILICACTVATTRENPRVDLAPDQTASMLCGMIMLFPPAALCASRAHPRRGPSPNMLIDMHCAHRQTPNARARSSPSSLSVGCVHFPPPLTTAQTNTHSRTCFLPLSLCSVFAPLSRTILLLVLSLNSRIDRRPFSEKSQQPRYDPVVPSSKTTSFPSLRSTCDSSKKRREEMGVTRVQSSTGSVPAFS